MPGETDRDVLQADSGHDSHAVPLIESVHRDLVAGGRELQCRELIIAALGLLEQQHVQVVALEQADDAVDTGADGVDVPGRDTHWADLCHLVQRSIRETSQTIQFATVNRARRCFGCSISSAMATAKSSAEIVSPAGESSAIR